MRKDKYLGVSVFKKKTQCLPLAKTLLCAFGNVETVRDPDTGDYRSVRVIDYSVIATRTVIVVHASRWLTSSSTRAWEQSTRLSARAKSPRLLRKKQAIMKAVNFMAGKNEVAEMAQSNAVLFGATSGKAHHKDRIIALRQERAWLDAEEQLLLAQL